MGDILKKITELLENGGNYEERRSTGIIINSNWFDAIDGVAFEGSGQDKKEDSATPEKRTWQAINLIP